jgi:uroporphyrinogen-III synthase
VDVVPVTTTHWRDDDELVTSFESLSSRTVAVMSAKAAHAAALAVRAGHHGPMLAVGPATAQALRDEGLIPTAIAQPSTSVALAALVTEGPVLVPGAEEPLRDFDEALAARHIEVVRVTAYRTTPRALDDDEKFRLAGADVVLVAAPSAWYAIADVIPASTLVVATGPTTGAVVAAEHHVSAVATSPEEIVAAWRARK